MAALYEVLYVQIGIGIIIYATLVLMIEFPKFVYDCACCLCVCATCTFVMLLGDLISYSLVHPIKFNLASRFQVVWQLGEGSFWLA